MHIRKCIFLYILSVVLSVATTNGSEDDSTETEPQRVDRSHIASVTRPYMLVLNARALTIRKFLCGAALVTESWAITSATCLDSYTPPLLLHSFFFYELIAGVNVFDKLSSFSQLRAVGQYYKHYLFKYQLLYDKNYDVALLKTKEPFALNDKVCPLSLPEAGFDFKTITTLTFSGWIIFRKINQITTTYKLQEEQVNYLSKEDCIKQVTEKGYKGMFPELGHETDTYICTTPVVDDIECLKNNGSVLVHFMPRAANSRACVKDGQVPVLVGIGPTYFDHQKCGRVQVPILFTDTSNFTDFYKAHLSN